MPSASPAQSRRFVHVICPVIAVNWPPGHAGQALVRVASMLAVPAAHIWQELWFAVVL